MDCAEWARRSRLPQTDFQKVTTLQVQRYVEDMAKDCTVLSWRTIKLSGKYKEHTVLPAAIKWATSTCTFLSPPLKSYHLWLEAFTRIMKMFCCQLLCFSFPTEKRRIAHWMTSILSFKKTSSELFFFFAWIPCLAWPMWLNKHRKKEQQKSVNFLCYIQKMSNTGS